MRLSFWAAYAATGLAVGCAALPGSGSAGAAIERPALVVVVSIDQMRDDQLDLLAGFYRGGFKRLKDEGRRFPAAWVDHATTNSSPGHATIATGAYPRSHGLVDNSWKELRDGSWTRVYAEDMLPANCDAPAAEARPGLAVETLGERTIGSGGKFLAISAGREIAKLYADGASRSAVWLSPEDGGFRTTRCAPAPVWLTRFNAEELTSFAADRWERTLPAAASAILRADESPFEGEGGPFAFPHAAPVDAENRLLWFYDTPAADEAMLALAARAIEAERLGADDAPDLLNVVVNSIDNVGHKFGPFSVEQADALYRLDAALGAFMGGLDRLVGEGRWVLALTADHGAPPAPEAREAKGAPTARRLSEHEVAEIIKAAHEAAAGFAPDDPARVDAVVKAVESYDVVAAALTEARIRERAAAGDKIGRLYEKSLIAGRVFRHPFYDVDGKGLAEFGVVPLLKEHVVVDWATSVHGSPYDYDRRVPMAFIGGCVAAGASRAEIRTVDLAPTLARLMGFSAPNASDGRAATIEGCGR